jgi:hypothetical protein
MKDDIRVAGCNWRGYADADKVGFGLLYCLRLGGLKPSPLGDGFQRVRAR